MDNETNTTPTTDSPPAGEDNPNSSGPDSGPADNSSGSAASKSPSSNSSSSDSSGSDGSISGGSTSDGSTSDGSTPTSQPSQTELITSWLRGRLPEEWTSNPPEVTVDREEITVVVSLPGASGNAEETDGRISRFRETTRRDRMKIADEAERRYGRKVAWGVSTEGQRHLFTTLAVPVMTRLRQPERLVLDTLVEAGVARSRAQAMAWCVRLVGQRSETWLADLREAMSGVEKVRQAGPTS